MEQVLISLKMPGIISLGILDHKRKELVLLGNILRSGEINAISKQLRKTFDAGATRENILTVASFVIGDSTVLNVIIELLKAIRYEENNRAQNISILEDCKEID
jgi:alkylhydroperoxidase/carboxymuconolactone decarboxylase family protein YurZ